MKGFDPLLTLLTLAPLLTRSFAIFYICPMYQLVTFSCFFLVLCSHYANLYSCYLFIHYNAQNGCLYRNICSTLWGRGHVRLHCFLPRPYFRVGFNRSVLFGLLFTPFGFIDFEFHIVIVNRENHIIPLFVERRMYEVI